METEVKKIPYLDLKAINEPYEKEIKDAINKVVNSGWYLQGEAVKMFEKSYAQFIGTEYCISCANGTDALKLMLMGELAIGKLQKGDGLPKFTLSSSQNFRYRNFDLALFFRGAFGYDIFNSPDF